MAWSGEHPDGAMPYLLAYSLGDGDGDGDGGDGDGGGDGGDRDGDRDGAEGSAVAVERWLRAGGLSLGPSVVDATRQPDFPVRLLVEGDRALVGVAPLRGTAPLRAECPVPPEWLTAIGERGYAYLLFTTRPWPEAEPGRPVTPEALAAFAGDEETLTNAAHVLVPARVLRG